MFSFFFSSRRRHTRFDCDWSSDVCSSDLLTPDEPQRHLACPPLVHDELARPLDDVRVEAPAEPAICGYDDEQRPAGGGTLAKERMRVWIDARGKAIQDAGHALCVRTRRDDPILRALETRRGNHLHRFGNLLRRFDGADSPAQVNE